MTAKRRPKWKTKCEKCETYRFRIAELEWRLVKKDRLFMLWNTARPKVNDLLRIDRSDAHEWVVFVAEGGAKWTALPAGTRLGTFYTMIDSEASPRFQSADRDGFGGMLPFDMRGEWHIVERCLMALLTEAHETVTVPPGRSV